MRPPLLPATAFLPLLVACGGGDRAAPEVEQASAPASQVLAPPPVAPAYEVVEVADGGSVEGVIRYSGIRRDEPVPVDRDLPICDPDGDGMMPAGSIALGGGGVLSGAIVRIEGIASGAAFAPPEPVIDNLGCVFVPRLQLAATGQLLTATNSDPILHNTHLFQSAGNRSLVNIALPGAGNTARKPLRKAGLIDVRCDAHKWMAAHVWVSDHPYVALSGVDGRFRIDGVPPGTWQAVAWHEVFGERRAEVQVAPGGTVTLDVTFE